MGFAKKSIDHLGQEFNSELAMCKYWGVTQSSYRYKLEKGYTREQALIKSEVVGHRVICTDHKGIEYPSKRAMCAAYDIAAMTYSKRLKGGATVEQALDPYWVRPKESVVFDHEGKGFTSDSAMAKYWGISHDCFKLRQAKGFTLKQALTGKGIPNPHCKPCIDHLGQGFKSLGEMAKHWGITVPVYRSRRNKGLSVKDALTGRGVLSHGKNNVVYDKEGNLFPDMESLHKYWQD